MEFKSGLRIDKSPVFHLIQNGVIEGDGVIQNDKLLKDIASIYASPKAASADNSKIAYSVYSYTNGDEKILGNLFWGLSVLYPFTVDGECNMTRGHFHQDRNCAEYYFGITGTGLLLLMDETGYTWAEHIERGSLHHIAGHLAHRLINTGAEILKVGACWPTTAGHDYKAIENSPFGYRIFKKNGKIITKKRN